MRVGCGSATIGMFAQQWYEHVDEVVVVDDHITGVLSEHQAGRYLDIPPTGIKVKGRRSTPGRYFNVANPGHGLGRHRYRGSADDPRRVRPRGGASRADAADDRHDRRAPRVLRARRRPAPGADAAPRRPAPLGRAHPRELRAGHDLGAVHGGCRRLATRRRHGEPGRADPLGAPDADEGHVRRRPGLHLAGRRHHVHGRRHAVPPGAFGYVPTPALVAPLEFTMRRDDYAALGGHMDAIVPSTRCSRRPDVRRRRERPGRGRRPTGRACTCSTARST